MKTRSLLFSLPLLTACGADPAKIPPASIPVAPVASSAPPPTARAHAAVARARFNMLAVEANLPLFWAADKNGDGAVDADEVVDLLFYDAHAPGASRWVDGGKLSAEFEAAYAKIEKAASATPTGSDAEAQRRRLVIEDLEQGAPTLVYSDLRGVSDAEKRMVTHVLAASRLIDALYATQSGIVALLPQVPGDDPASQSLFRRNWGPKCIGPKTEKNPLCSAIPGAPAPLVDVYPASLQRDPKFCDALEKRADAKALLTPFTVVREKKGTLASVPLPKAYPQMAEVAKELRAAAIAIEGSDREKAMHAYLEAAAKSFEDGDWERADEAWSNMNAQNSKWFLRIGPDELYWEPCNHKAGLHATFARINEGSLKWQEKLVPVQQDMENALGAHIGAPYKARKVTFHLPDFIDVVLTAGDDRNGIGATIGQSLPNVGKVAAEGRGRTVAMSNLYTDPDSMRFRRLGAESLLVKDSMASYLDDPGAGMLKTILHEATHNLGPAHEYAFKGKTDQQWFGGGLASMLEELKAETGALYFTDWLLKKGVLDAETAKHAYTDGIVWAFGHIARGMYSDGGQRKPYSQLAAVQVGFLLDEGAMTFDANATAANGTDKGAFTIHLEKMPAASEKLMKIVGAIKASGDKVAAEALAKKYVDGDVVPHKTITERILRHPKASFVYAIDL